MRTIREELYLLHVLSALHVGGDNGDGFIDQPVARESASGFPLVPGSALKGVLRDEIAPWDRSDGRRKALFGTGGDDDGGAQGALTVGDARLLCLPVRSLAGVFAWVTCPLVLGRFLREARWLSAAEVDPTLPSSIPSPTKSHQVLVSSGSALTVGDENCLYLGPLKAHPLEGRCDTNVGCWATAIAEQIYLLEAEREIDRRTFITPFVDRFAVASDTVFAYLCQTALELRPRISIDDKTGVANNLWYVEALPPETVLWGGLRLLAEGRDESAARVELDEFAALLPHRLRLQIGGSATVGFGQCLWLRPQAVPVLPGLAEAVP